MIEDYAEELATFATQHCYDSFIVNPDLKEKNMIRLSGLLLFKPCIKIMEKNLTAQKHFLPNLMQSFDKTLVYSVTKNFLRFS